MIVLKILGKQNCAPCQSAKNKWSTMLDKWNMRDKINFVFKDIETEEGRAEAEFYEVKDVPFTVIEVDDEPVKSWKDKIVDNNEVKKVLESLI